jgi:hypothetical protein
VIELQNQWQFAAKNQWILRISGLAHCFDVEEVERMSIPRVCGRWSGNTVPNSSAGLSIVSPGTLGYSLHSACMSFKRNGATGIWPMTNLNYRFRTAWDPT